MFGISEAGVHFNPMKHCGNFRDRALNLSLAAVGSAADLTWTGGPKLWSRPGSTIIGDPSCTHSFPDCKGLSVISQSVLARLMGGRVGLRGACGSGEG